MVHLSVCLSYTSASITHTHTHSHSLFAAGGETGNGPLLTEQLSADTGIGRDAVIAKPTGE